MFILLSILLGIGALFLIPYVVLFGYTNILLPIFAFLPPLTYRQMWAIIIFFVTLKTGKASNQLEKKNVDVKKAFLIISIMLLLGWLFNLCLLVIGSKLI